jgi:hypothetical protein
MRTPLSLRYALGSFAVAACALSGASCADMARTGSGPAYLIMESVAGSAGGGTTFTSNLLSDVQTIIEVTVGTQTVQQPTIFNDLGQATIRAEMKNTVTPTTPTALHSITLTRYRVRYRRSDGRNTEGVDVPYGFDGGTTANIPIGGSVKVNFDLVRHQAKLERPLIALTGGGGFIFISTIAEVTFYGHDQAGNEVSITGSIDVQFGDFADEE